MASARRAGFDTHSRREIDSVGWLRGCVTDRIRCRGVKCLDVPDDCEDVLIASHQVVSDASVDDGTNGTRASCDVLATREDEREHETDRVHLVEYVGLLEGTNSRVENRPDAVRTRSGSAPNRVPWLGRSQIASPYRGPFVFLYQNDPVAQVAVQVTLRMNEVEPVESVSAGPGPDGGYRVQALLRIPRGSA